MRWSARVAARASARSRAEKTRFLLERIPPGSSVLLVGVAPGGGVASRNVIESALSEHCPAVGLCYERPAGAPLPGVPLVRGDGRRLPFADGSFDYVVSNAVIEHLGGVEGARRLLDESLRVARCGYFHTTPNRRFPVETHTLLPLLHWSPRRWQHRVFGWAGKPFPPSRYWLFTPRSLRGLRPTLTVTRLGRGPVAMTLVVGENVTRSAAPD